MFNIFGLFLGRPPSFRIVSSDLELYHRGRRVNDTYFQLLPQKSQQKASISLGSRVEMLRMFKNNTNWTFWSKVWSKLFLTGICLTPSTKGSIRRRIKCSGRLLTILGIGYDSVEWRMPSNHIKTLISIEALAGDYSLNHLMAKMGCRQ